MTAAVHGATQAFYERHAEQYYAATAHLDARALYDPFLKELRPGAHILDAGCGSGRDAKAFVDLGYRVTAIDASPGLAHRAAALTGAPCAVLSFEEIAFENAFDGIWACASVVHVPKRNVPDVMRRFVRALEPGGVLYLSLREGEGERIEEDGRFFSYYTAATFRDAIAPGPAVYELACWTTPDLRSSPSAAVARPPSANGIESATDRAADRRLPTADCRPPTADSRPPTWLNVLLKKPGPAPRVTGT